MFKQPICFEIWGGTNGKYRLVDSNGEAIDKTPEDTCDRVAKALSDVETNDKDDWRKKIRSILGTKFAGGGRIMANAGSHAHKKEVSLINCVVASQIADSMEAIMDVAKEAGLVLKSGCGIGYDFSTLRPKGARVFGAGAGTSGVISFMKVFDTICSTILSGGGRRGSQLGALDVQHPDIEEFITAKRQDGMLRYFNVSVLITDRFMKAVENKEEWKLWFWEKIRSNGKAVDGATVQTIKKSDIPYRYPESEYFQFAEDHVEVKYGNCKSTDVFRKKVYKTVKAAELFDTIIKSTYEFSDPGFLLIDRVNTENNLWFTETIRTTNPCVVGSTRLHTDLGMIKAEDLYHSQAAIKCTVDNRTLTGEIGTSVRDAVPVFKTGDMEKVYRVQTKAGYEITATEWHKFYTQRGKIELKDLKIGDELMIQSGMGQFGTQGSYEIGHAFGMFMRDGNINERHEDRKTSLGILYKTAGFNVRTAAEIPEFIWQGTMECVAGFLHGLFRWDGTFGGKAETSIWKRRPEFLKRVQMILANYGVMSELTTRINKSFGTHDPIFDLTLINPSRIDRFSTIITAIEYAGEEATYDTTQDDHHSLVFQGIVTGNCGEQNLGPNANCLLGSMILPSYVQDAFTTKALFDFDQFKKDIRIANRALDNVVEIANLPLKMLADTLRHQRRHGLGFTGLGSMFNMLRISYGSKDSIALAEKISLIMAQESLLENIEVAKEKGPAPVFATREAREQFMQSGYMQRLLPTFKNKDQVIKDILQYGVRWSHATSIAPTGTMSLTWANNCSNGIEPVFANSYLRNIREAGKKTKSQQEVLDYAYYEWKQKFKDKALPDYWRTTDDLTVKEHTDVQEVVQRWVDASISKTINVPTDYPYDKFKDVYIRGWKAKLKGMTTFRFNPNIASGVLVQQHDLDNTQYAFVLEDGSEIAAKGSDTIHYDGEDHIAANLFDALKEGLYGNM